MTKFESSIEEGPWEDRSSEGAVPDEEQELAGAALVFRLDADLDSEFELTMQSDDDSEGVDLMAAIGWSIESGGISLKTERGVVHDNDRGLRYEEDAELDDASTGDLEGKESAFCGVIGGIGVAGTAAARRVGDNFNEENVESEPEDDALNDVEADDEAERDGIGGNFELYDVAE
jgi:hypothetical protein